MAAKKGNTYIQITLTKFHADKLRLICSRTGLSKSGVIQRLIEQYSIMGWDPDKQIKPVDK